MREREGEQGLARYGVFSFSVSNRGRAGSGWCCAIVRERLHLSLLSLCVVWTPPPLSLALSVLVLSIRRCRDIYLSRNEGASSSIRYRRARVVIYHHCSVA